jgi:FtsH-binding integral membrane protein
MEENNKLYSKMFMWLFIGLLITFIVGYVLSLNYNVYISIIKIGVLPFVITELAIALIMSLLIKKMSVSTLKILFIIYSIITGITFGSIFIMYKISSIISIFAISALIFGLLALYGYKTNRDLTQIGRILFFSLLGLIIGELLNFAIFKSSGAAILGSVICVLIFTLYIAYDTNRVKYLLPAIGEDKAAIYGAFQLYLDFINLFIRLLELFGNRKD